MKYNTYNKKWSNNWLTFYPEKDYRGFYFRYSPRSYFNSRPRIYTYVSSLLTIIAFIIISVSSLSLLWILLLIPTLFFSWGQLSISFPCNSTVIDSCERSDYLIDFYSVDGEFPNHVWIMGGKKNKTIYFPWAFKWHRTSLLLKDGTWEHEKKGFRKEFWEDKWKEIRFEESYPYTYTLNSGEKQEKTALIAVEEREWRRYYTPFTKLFNKVDKTITVEFSDEVGERSGSWKGGTISCGYSMKKGETPLQCLQRMSRERKF